MNQPQDHLEKPSGWKYLHTPMQNFSLIWLLVLEIFIHLPFNPRKPESWIWLYTKFQVNWTIGAGNNPRNPESAPESAGEALGMEVPNILLGHFRICLYTKFQVNRTIGAGNNPRNFESVPESAGETLGMEVPNILLGHLKICSVQNFRSIGPLVQ